MSREKVIKKLTDGGHSADEAEKITDELYMWAGLVTNHLQNQLKIRKGYLDLRNKYRPEDVRAIFVLESPPKSGKYFYNNEGDTSEPLFKAMMKLIGLEPKDKESGLKEFKKLSLTIGPGESIQSEGMQSQESFWAVADKGIAQVKVREITEE